MAGRMGSEQKKIKGLSIVEVNNEKNEILITGPIPGRNGTLLVIEKVGGETINA